jgi:N-acyl-D-aspartate/D-glutamate deacylase
MVKRLSKDAADLFGVKGGTINVGDVADLILVDPQALANYDGEAQVIRQFRAEYNHDQLVNRSDGVVPLVMIAGNVAWEHDDFSSQFGKKPMGRLLRAVAN